MKNCPKCGVEHTKKGTFCSRTCGNSRVWSKEVNERRSKKNKRHWRKGTYDHLDLSTQLAKAREIARQNKANIPFEDLKSTDGRRSRVLKEQDNRCNRCANSEWLGEPLTLELEHKDGDITNNSRSNLECLCPNCHSLTKTWRGRNLGSSKRNVVSDEQLINALKASSNNVRQALIAVGMSPRGANYKRCYKLMDFSAV